MNKNNKKLYHKYIFDPIGLLIFIVFTVIPAMWGIYIWQKPKKECKITDSYVNYHTSELIEQRECEIYFGKLFFFKEIELHKIAYNTIVTLYCKPLIALKTGLPADCYEEKTINANKKISLIRNKFYEANEVELVYIDECTKIDDDFKENISVNAVNNTIEIFNNNFHEIREFPLSLPDSVNIENVSQIFGEFKLMTRHLEGGVDSMIIYLVLPARLGEKAGNRIIILPS